ncbi:hypothetical protein NA56DRAFT_693805 [Hyaloscypha hepaticicola]|uniref:Uncharacterized protein n=1 Tax=Hyaloscypha hepaticicola TaxID=2082293 RepID=A0A2J6PL24_9HELO|nr:hypothetical protein NA56DRAFT_693805 [Hyaloscypha hepaticicola]
MSQNDTRSNSAVHGSANEFGDISSNLQDDGKELTTQRLQAFIADDSLRPVHAYGGAALAQARERMTRMIQAIDKSLDNNSVKNLNNSGTDFKKLPCVPNASSTLLEHMLKHSQGRDFSVGSFRYTASSRDIAALCEAVECKAPFLSAMRHQIHFGNATYTTINDRAGRTIAAYHGVQVARHRAAATQLARFSHWLRFTRTCSSENPDAAIPHIPSHLRRPAAYHDALINCTLTTPAGDNASRYCDDQKARLLSRTAINWSQRKMSFTVYATLQL